MDETACLEGADVKLLRATFALALVVYPEQLDYDRLLRELGPSKATGVEAAVGALAAAGLIHRDQVGITPSRPALCFDQIGV